MPWQAIDPRLLVQEDPAAIFFWYRDDDRLQPGDLRLWVDSAGRVVRFQLSHTPAVGAGELFAAWETGRSVRTGQVESDRRSRLGHPRSRLIRRRHLEPAELVLLRDYVAANAWVAPESAAVVIAVLESVPR